MDSNASNASSSEVWPEDTHTSPSTVSPVARPKMRSTIRDLAHHKLAVLPQNLPYVDRSLPQFAPEARTPRGRHFGANRRSRCEKGVVHDYVHEVCRLSRKRSGRKFSCQEKHQLLRVEDLVLHYTKADPRARRRRSVWSKDS